MLNTITHALLWMCGCVVYYNCYLSEKRTFVLMARSLL